MEKNLWDIKFNINTSEFANGWGSKITHTDNLTDKKYTADGQGDTPSFSINAVDIDWNAADLQSAVSQASTNTSEDLSITGINTTGDLIKVVAEQQAQIKSLSLLVKALYESIVVQSEVEPEIDEFYVFTTDEEIILDSSNYTNYTIEANSKLDNIDNDNTYHFSLNKDQYVYIIVSKHKQIELYNSEEHQYISMFDNTHTAWTDVRDVNADNINNYIIQNKYIFYKSTNKIQTDSCSIVYTNR